MDATFSIRPMRRRGRAIDVSFEGSTFLRPLRRMLASLLAGQPDNVRIDADLVATELVTNAVEHAVPPHRVRVTTTASGRVRIAVTDGDPHSEPTKGVSRWGRHRGRGLVVVDGVARWGVRRGRTTKTIWAVLNPAT